MMYIANFIASTKFRHVRRFGEFTFYKLLDKVVVGVGEDGSIIVEENPKVILEKTMPKKFEKWASITNWVECRRWKNAIQYNHYLSSL